MKLDEDYEKVINELKENFGWGNLDILPGNYQDLLNDTIMAVKNLTIQRATSSVLFSRVWAMPNKLTFTIKPIKELIEKYVKENQVIIDPFANESKYGTIRNDLNPEFDTHYHLDALSFLKLMESNSADVVLYDPPYSITQAAQCYKDYGKDKLEQNVANMSYWSNCKNEVARILKPNGIVIICGWNTNGIGLKRGFQMLEILAVPHGGSKNDTLCTVERKLPTLF
jgi:hypothetical protein